MKGKRTKIYAAVVAVLQGLCTIKPAWVPYFELVKPVLDILIVPAGIWAMRNVSTGPAKPILG